MSFSHNAAPPTAGGGSSLLPDGEYELQITETKEKATKKGYPMVNVTCEVRNHAVLNGKKVFYNVTFLPDPAMPGAGISVHFLKCINQEWDGAITVNPSEWIGELFKAKIGTREYKNKEGKMVKTNDVLSVEGTVPF